MSKFPDTIEMDFQLAMHLTKCLKGVIYRNADYDEDEDCDEHNPYAYLCADTITTGYVVNCFPLDEDLDVVEGVDKPKPTQTNSMDEPLGYDGDLI